MDDLEAGRKLIEGLPIHPEDGGPSTINTLLRQNSYLLAMVAILLDKQVKAWRG